MTLHFPKSFLTAKHLIFLLHNFLSSLTTPTGFLFYFIWFMTFLTTLFYGMCTVSKCRLAIFVTTVHFDPSTLLPCITQITLTITLSPPSLHVTCQSIYRRLKQRFAPIVIRISFEIEKTSPIHHPYQSRGSP